MRIVPSVLLIGLLCGTRLATACPTSAASVVVPTALPVVAVQSFAVPSVAVLTTPTVVASPTVFAPTVVIEEVVRRPRARVQVNRVRVRVQ